MLTEQPAKQAGVFRSLTSHLNSKTPRLIAVVRRVQGPAIFQGALPCAFNLRREGRPSSPPSRDSAYRCFRVPRPSRSYFDRFAVNSCAG